LHKIKILAHKSDINYNVYINNDMRIRILEKPAAIIPLSFILLILTGTAILYLGPSRINGNLSFIDALFTATSATSCTGLIVLDTGSEFTRFGHIVILALIQLGGLGIMTFSTLFVLLFTRKLTIHGRVLLQESLTQFPLRDVVPLLRTIFMWVVLIEAAGVGLLFIIQRGNADNVLFSSVFHGISAFCNAGFSLYRNSFCGYRENTGFNLVITTLIILGGLGFAVLWDLQRKIFRREKIPFSLQTKIVLSASISLILIGAVFIFLLEYNNSLSALPLKGKLLISYFQSVTARTAGFNTIPVPRLGGATLFILMALMFIGGSPGSTCGGIKTTTAAIFLKNIVSRLTQRAEVNFFKRAVKRESVERALLIVALALFLILTVTFFLLIIEKGELLSLLFEAVSAFATVGLSKGITPGLSVLGKLFIIITMYTGKLGPLTLTAFFVARQKKVLYRYPSENIMTG
jgi:trk system potassium uptake protein TrkH